MGEGVSVLTKLSTPFAAFGDFFALTTEASRELFRRPFQWRETVECSWAIARVSMVPTLLVAIPFTVLVSFTLNILLREIGAQDLSERARPWAPSPRSARSSPC